MRVPFAEDCGVEPERLLVQRQRLGITAEVVVRLRQIVEARQRKRVPFAEDCGVAEAPSRQQRSA